MDAILHSPPLSGSGDFRSTRRLEQRNGSSKIKLLENGCRATERGEGEGIIQRAEPRELFCLFVLLSSNIIASGEPGARALGEAFILETIFVPSR